MIDEAKPIRETTATGRTGKRPGTLSQRWMLDMQSTFPRRLSTLFRYHSTAPVDFRDRVSVATWLVVFGLGGSLLVELPTIIFRAWAFGSPISVRLRASSGLCSFLAMLAAAGAQSIVSVHPIMGVRHDGAGMSTWPLLGIANGVDQYRSRYAAASAWARDAGGCADRSGDRDRAGILWSLCDCGCRDGRITSCAFVAGCTGLQQRSTAIPVRLSDAYAQPVVRHVDCANCHITSAWRFCARWRTGRSRRCFTAVSSGLCWDR